MQGQLQHLHEVEVAGQDIGFLAERSDLDTAAAPAGPRVLDGLPLAQLLGHGRVRVEQGRKTVALPDDAQRVLEHFVGGLDRHLYVGARLQEVHLVHDVEKDVRHLVRPVGAVRQQPADVDVREVGIRAAFRGRDPDLRRGRVVVELDEERLEEFPRRVPGKAPVGQSSLVERQQVLVQVTGVERIPPVQFRDHAEVAEPVVLQGLVEVARSVLRHVPAGGRDLLQRRPLGGIRFGCGLRFRECRVPVGEPDQGVARDPHGVQRLAPVLRHRVLGEVQSGQRGIDVGLETRHSLRVDLVVEHGVAGGSLFHELGEHAGFVRFVPLAGERLEQPVAQRAAGPERNHGRLVVDDRFIRYRVAGHGPRVEDPQILDGVTRQLGKRRHGLGLRAPFTDDQLALSVVQRLVLAQVEERPRPQNRRGQSAEVLLVEAGDQHGALRGDARHRFQALPPKPLGSIGHSFILRLR